MIVVQNAYAAAPTQGAPSAVLISATEKTFPPKAPSGALTVSR